MPVRWQSGPNGLSEPWHTDPTMAIGRLPVLPKPDMMIVNRKNWGGGRQMIATMYPRTQPVAVVMSTLTGTNHQSKTSLRVTDWPRWTKMRQGRKRAKTSLLRSLKVARGTIWIRGCARMRPMTVRHNSFNKGSTADSKLSLPLAIPRAILTKITKNPPLLLEYI